ncbi:MAG: hypothetical protein R2823_05155 [Acidimicrobiia bacterium]
MERSQGKIGGDVVIDKLESFGFTGSDRTDRRVPAEAKANYRAGRRRVYRPWITEPGMSAQWECGMAPEWMVGRRSCGARGWRGPDRGWFPDLGQILPTVIGCLDQAMRRFGGAPTYWLTDNKRTVTIENVAGSRFVIR